MLDRLIYMDRNELFQSYRTSTYKFHFFESLSGYKFILLSDPLADNMQFALKAIYSGPFLDFVVRNDLVGVKGGGLDETWGVEARKGKIRGRGIDNDRVRACPVCPSPTYDGLTQLALFHDSSVQL
jgi:hypothetical protein